MEELNSELEELKELSAKRLDELEKKTNEHKEALKEVERLKMDVSVGCDTASPFHIDHSEEWSEQTEGMCFGAGDIWLSFFARL